MSIGRIPNPGICMGCGGTLPPVEFTAIAKDMNQYKDAMNLVFVPGFGEAIDGDQLVDFVLCKTCVGILFDAFPGLEEKLTVYSDSSMTGPSRELMKIRPNED